MRAQVEEYLCVCGTPSMFVGMCRSVHVFGVASSPFSMEDSMGLILLSTVTPFF